MFARFAVFILWTVFFENLVLCEYEFSEPPPDNKRSQWVVEDVIDIPVQLVKPSADHKRLVIDQENLKLLSQIRGAVATVTVVGKYHSGKSFLMNQLMRKSAGFGIGSTIEPQTMGIWMWGKPLSIVDRTTGAKMSVVFLDTEGFTANNVSETYDAKIFAVSTLLSSYLIYNSVKIIDQTDIDYLELLARRTRLFALRSQLSKGKWSSDFNRDVLSFPPLLWVVQDFVQSKEGLSPTDWLHRLMSSHVRENENYEISLLSIFDRVDCHTLFLPTAHKKLLVDLSLAREEELTEDYREERDALARTLFSNLKPKEKNNQPISGLGLSKLLEILVTAANDGSLSEVPTRWAAFLKGLQKMAVEDCVKFYEAEMDVIRQNHSGGPVHPSDLQEWHQAASSSALELLDHLLFGLTDAVNQSRTDLEAMVELKYDTRRILNAKQITMKCSEIRNKIEIDCDRNLSELQLPSGETIIQEIIKKQIISGLITFKAAVASFTSDDGLQDCIGKLETTLGQLGSTLLHKNRVLVEEHLKMATSRASEIFQESSKNPTSKPRLPRSLTLTLTEAHRLGLKEFDRLAVLVVGESLVEPYRALLLKNLEALALARHTENEKLVKTFGLKMVADLTEKATEQTSKIALPLNTQELATRLKQELGRVESLYAESMTEFRSYAVTVDLHDTLLERLAKVRKQRVTENVEAYTREVEGPLKRAKDIILLVADSHSTTFSLKKYMLQVCLLNLDEGSAKQWSLELKQQIVDHFVVTDADLSKKLSEKQGIWSSVLGFFQWLLFVLNVTS